MSCFKIKLLKALATRNTPLFPSSCGIISDLDRTTLTRVGWECLGFTRSNFAKKNKTLLAVYIKVMLQSGRFAKTILAQHSIATLLWHCFEWLHHCSSIATLLWHCFEWLHHCSSIATLLRIIPCNITFSAGFRTVNSQSDLRILL